MKASGYLEGKKEEAERLKKEVDLTKKICERFDDLEIHTNRWRQKRYFSSHMNAIADDYYISHNCGCCRDSPLEAWPFKEVDGEKVFSPPPVFQVGQKNMYYDYDDVYGVEPLDAAYVCWWKDMRDAKINEKVIKKVVECFKSNDEDPGDWEVKKEEDV